MVKKMKCRMNWRVFIFPLFFIFLLALDVFAAGEPVNINTASVEELCTLPGMKAGLAEKIIAYRNTYGAFKKISEITRVKGIGEKTFEKLKPLITVGDGETVVKIPVEAVDFTKSGIQKSARIKQGTLININTASPAELSTLPGVGKGLARRIIEYRNEKGAFTSVEDLRKIKGVGDRTFEKLKPLVTVGDGVTVVKYDLRSEGGGTAEISLPWPSQREFKGPLPGTLEVHIIDVGQGDSILLFTPENKAAILIDGGEKGMGSKVVVPYLRSLGIEKLDAAILTHPHSDHLGGFMEVLETFPCDAVYDYGSEHPTRMYEKFLAEEIARKGASPYKPRAGRTIEQMPGVQIKVLSPPSPVFSGTKRSDENNNSVTLMVEFSGKKILLTGDIEEEAEKFLNENYGKSLKADLLKVPHHGGEWAFDGEVGDKFLANVSPEYAVISVGRENAFGHPNKVSLQKLSRRGAKIFRTDECGTIVFRISGNSIKKVDD